MKQFIATFLLLVLFIQCKDNNHYTNSHSTAIKQHIVSNLNTLSVELQTFEKLIYATEDASKLQQQFLKCRLLFKDTEWATEYYLPKSSKSLNGPPLDQLDLDENKFLDAEGFQVLEEYLYPEVAFNEKKAMVQQIRIIDNLIRAGITNIEATNITDEQIFDALRLGIFKITTLGITGFDTPVSNLLFPENKAALKGIEVILSIYKDRLKDFKSYSELMLLLTNAQNQIDGLPDKNTFNYLNYITHYLDPIAKKMHLLQLNAEIAFVNRVSMLKPNAASLFEKESFDTDAVAANVVYKSSHEKINLGKRLFYDTQLSKNNDRSCATCHQPEKAFTDGLKVATDLVGSPLLRNTPSLNYAGFYHGQFWDMRQSDIESLTTNVIENKNEMHGDMVTILNLVKKDTVYAKYFRNVFNTENIETRHIQNALAVYVRSLSTFSSKFDMYMQGNSKALTKQEQHGFNLFIGKAKCATCHFIPLFNGTVPPRFSSSEQEVLGIPFNAAVTKLDTDLGRQLYNMDLEQLKNSFKTVTVRNIEKTAPYMHNGVFSTLEEVVIFYNKGGGSGFGLNVPNQTLPTDALNLTKQEEAALVAFMKTLNDT